MKTSARASWVLRHVLLGTAAVSFAVAMPPMFPLGLVGAAHAQTTGSGGGGGMSHAPGGTSGSAMGQGGPSGVNGHYGQGGSTGTETGTEGTSTDRQGPRFGGGENSSRPAAGTTGGRPVWAKEGIPAVELGRLSVARAPEHVIDKALAEAVSNWAAMGTTVMTLTADGEPDLTMTVAQFYSLPAAEFAYVLQTYYASIVRIDSPLENLGLLKNLAMTGTTALTGVTPATGDDLYAIFLGSASDKTIPISADTVTAVNTILGLPPLTPEATADIAAKAEDVRLAILAGHG